MKSIRRGRARAILLAGALMLALLAPRARAEQAVDFNREIRPILAADCLKCHGIDEGARKKGLRLDVRESATAPLKEGERAIVPGKPQESELVRRIFAANPDDVMPPASTHTVLTDAQKNLLKQWIAEGAKYETHWAFVAPRQAPLPPVRQAEWVKNPIDRFVLAKLEAQGLHPSAEADRYTLARRVYLDLIGLPPTLQEADAFVNDASPDAYEKLVDRLLASPHYGERWARRWMDLARYADTNGYEKDRPRSIWPWRDWVIDALNHDMPFDQFTIKQIAGDMLPGATVEDRIATGFHRNTMKNEEGGIDPQEYRFYSMVDRVSVTGQTWLGLTVQCAQCHTHKYDPITHTDYYSLMALMNNADEPEMEIPSADITSRRAEIEKKIARLTEELPSKVKIEDVNWTTPSPAQTKVEVASKATAKAEKDGSWKFTGESPEKDTYTFTIDASPSSGPVDRIRLEAIADGKKGPGRTPHGNFVLSEITVTVAPQDAPGNAEPVKLAKAEADFGQKDYPAEHAIDGKRDTGWAVGGAEGKNHTATFTFDKPVALSGPARWTIKLDQQFGQHHTLAHLKLSLGTKVNDPRPIDVRRKETLDRNFAAWEQAQSAKAVKWTVLRPDQIESSLPTLTLLPDDSILAGGDVTKSDTYDCTFHGDFANVTAVRLEALPDDSLPKHGPGLIAYEGPFGDFVLSEIKLSADGKDAKFASAMQSYFAPGNPASLSIDGNPQTGWMINGGQGKAHQAVFALAEPTGQAKELKVRMLFERYYACPLGHFRISISTDPRAAQSSALPPAVEAALGTPSADRTPEQRDRIFQHYLSIAPELAEARKEIEQLRASLPNPPTTLVMRERPAGHARVTHRHHRGEYLQVKEQVQGNVPAFLPPLPDGAPHDRLALARWLVSPDNPLTARVTVNRQWQGFFGRGIVRTTADFGYQGDLPSNQDLLDWMAVEFVKEGWSMKKLDRLIVTSATYRQSSQATTEMLARDPENVLLARGPRFRLDAEQVRDSALRAAGVLSEKMGGPSVFPPQPASVTTEGAYGKLEWTTSTGEDRFRRSIYTFGKRTAPFALYNTFDAPSGEACVARRDVSNSPLQALALLNDTVFVEAAQAMGRAVAAKKDSDEARASEIFRRCLTRPPDNADLAMLVDFARRQRERFEKKELDPARIAGPGEGDVIERATWTTVARAVMNLDEMVTKE